MALKPNLHKQREILLKEQTIQHYYELYRLSHHDLFTDIEEIEENRLIRLYKSKLKFLEELRQVSFLDLNSSSQPHFHERDHSQILSAADQANERLRNLLINGLAKRCGSHN